MVSEYLAILVGVFEAFLGGGGVAGFLAALVEIFLDLVAAFG